MKTLQHLSAGVFAFAMILQPASALAADAELKFSRPPELTEGMTPADLMKQSDNYTDGVLTLGDQQFVFDENGHAVLKQPDEGWLCDWFGWWCPELVAGPMRITREQAQGIVRGKVIPDIQARMQLEAKRVLPILAFSWPTPVAKGTVIQQDFAENPPLNVFADSWFFFLDLEPHAYFGHRAEFVLVNGTTGEISRLKTFSPPVIGDDVRYLGVEERFMSADRFYPESLEDLPEQGAWPVTFESNLVPLPDPADMPAMGAQSGINSAVAPSTAYVGDGISSFIAPAVFAEAAVGVDPCAGKTPRKVGVVISGERPDRMNGGRTEGNDFLADTLNMANTMRGMGFADGDIHKFNPQTHPSLDDVWTRIKEITAGLGPCDKFFLFVTGHGSPPDKNADGQPDSPSTSISYRATGNKQYISKTRFGEHSLIQLLEGIHAGHINLMIDSCFSGSMQDIIRQQIANPAAGSTWNVFVASPNNEPSWTLSGRMGGEYTDAIAYCIRLKLFERGIANPTVAQMEEVMRECQSQLSLRPKDYGLTATPPLAGDVDPVTVTVSSDVSIQEGDSGVRYAEFTITRSPADRPISVRHGTYDPDPENSDLTHYANPRDYEWNKKGGTVDFAAGETTKTIRIAIYGDTEPEANESFGVHFWDIGQVRMVTIIDDDTPVTSSSSSTATQLPSSSSDSSEGGYTVSITIDYDKLNTVGYVGDYVTEEAPGGGIGLDEFDDWVKDLEKKYNEGGGVTTTPGIDGITIELVDPKCPECEELKAQIELQMMICEEFQIQLAEAKAELNDLNREIADAQKNLKAAQDALNAFNNPKSSASSNGRTIDSSDLQAERQWSRGLWNQYKAGDLTAQELEAEWREGLSDAEREKIKNDIRQQLEAAAKDAQAALDRLTAGRDAATEDVAELEELVDRCMDELMALIAELEECEKQCVPPGGTAMTGGETGGTPASASASASAPADGGQDAPEAKCPVCEELEQAIKDKIAECDEIEDELDAADDDMADLDKQIGDLEKELKAAEDALNNFDNPKSYAESEGRRVTSSDLAGQRQWARGLWGEYRNGNMSAQELEAAWGKGPSPEEMEKAKQEVRENLERQITGAKDDLADLRGKRDDLKKEAADLEGELDDCEAELDELIAEFLDCEKSCVETDDGIGVMTTGGDIGGGSASSASKPPPPSSSSKSSSSSSAHRDEQSSSSKSSSSSSRTTTGSQCTAPAQDLKSCKASCESNGAGECEGDGKGCYFCRVTDRFEPTCPSGTTPNRYECEEFCGHEGGTCVQDTPGCWSCTVATCPSGTYTNQCPSSCTSGCDVVGQEGSTQCLQCKKSCTEVCKDYAQVGTNWNSYILSQLNQYSCVSSATVSIESTTIGSCTCSNQPGVEIDQTKPYCKGTPCGDVICGGSASCQQGEATVTVNCNWGGWKNVGENQFQPIVGQ